MTSSIRSRFVKNVKKTQEQVSGISPVPRVVVGAVYMEGGGLLTSRFIKYNRRNMFIIDTICEEQRELLNRS